MDFLAKRAKERLQARHTVGLQPDQVRQNLLLGTATDRDEKWPRGAAAFNPTAARLSQETRAVRSLRR